MTFQYLSSNTKQRLDSDSRRTGDLASDQSAPAGGKLDFSRLPPYRGVVVAMALALAAFVALEGLQQLVFPELSGEALRLVNFARGYVATLVGMVFVWAVMHRKEIELTRLRDHFSEQLNRRTSELAQAAAGRALELSRVNAVMTSMGDAVIEVDEQGLINAVNPRTEDILRLGKQKILGLKAEELAGKFRMCDGCSGGPTLLEALSSCESGLTNDALYDLPDGSTAILSWTVSPVKYNDNHIGHVTTLTDVTERRALRAALLELKLDFLSVLTHKLRTPVLANQRSLHLLLGGAFGELTAEQRQIIEPLAANSSEMSKLLDMLLKLYRYRAGGATLNKGRFVLDGIIKEVLAEFENQSAAKGIKISYEGARDDLVIKCDRGEVKTLLGHLLDNGIRYARSKVTVRVARADPNDPVEIEVEDDGQGIDSQDIPDLFKRFYFMSKSGKYSPTVGVGLCLCAEIARAHGGDISCASTPGAGTKFTVALPVEKDETHPEG